MEVRRISRKGSLLKSIVVPTISDHGRRNIYCLPHLPGELGHLAL